MRNGNTSEPQCPVKLCIITQFYPPDYAATGQLIEELVTHLAQQDMDIQVFTGQPGYAFQKNSAPTTEQFEHLLVRRSRTSRLWPQRIRGKALNGLLFCLRSGLHLCKISRSRDVVLLTTAPPYLPVLGYLANLCFGLPYICLLYDLYPDVAVELNVISRRHWLTRFWYAVNRLVWKQAQGIIVLSSTMKDRIVTKCPEVTDKISIIHSWANPAWIAPIGKSENWFAQQHNLVGKFTVLYSGNMGRCHDMETILEAASQLRDQPIQFVFIGSGAKRQFCVDRVKALELDNCLFLPYQDKQTIPYSLTACDLALVSIDSGMEGLIAPSKLYGSLAAGRPIAAICEPHSYLRQLLVEARCGAAFNSGDVTGLASFIKGLSENQDLVQEMGRAGRQYLETNFTPEIIAKQYLQVLSTQARVATQRPRYEEEITLRMPKNSPTKLSFSRRLVRWLRS